MEKRTKDLESKPIAELFQKYFWPAFVGIMVTALYNVVDRIFIGQGVGAEALGGLSVVYPIMTIMVAFAMLIGQGAGIRISIYLGKKDYDRCERILGNAIFLMIIASLFVTVFGFWLKVPLLRIFGASDVLMSYANDYLDIILFGSVFQIGGFALNNILRSEGNAKKAMMSMVISAVVNIALDAVFIFILNMGVKGAALATVIAQITMTVMNLQYFLSSKAIVKFSYKYIYPQTEILKNIVSIGMSSFALQVAASMVQAIANTQLIKYGGDIAVASMGIINSIVLLIVMGIVAVTMSIQPIIGFNYGAKEMNRVKEAFWLGVKIATGISFFSWCVVEIAPDLIVDLFNADNEELKRISVNGLRIYLAVLPIIGFQIVISSFYQAIGLSKISLFLTLLRQVIIMIPFLLIMPNLLGLDGVWLVGPVSDFGAALVTTIIFAKKYKSLLGVA
ncbi:MATE family efflux transporter [Aureibacter tunicatorum]|uniref:Multidrug export protein MepA n=1 Tax=Aureibacter tunicatorum TaxID=866807 RepID=A0AAE3XJS9_9BACT|nr:MATE family efflux transporter [Aureibacter tunicatorum]MDR6237061.1 putative MATE family efflux protein [Aureibacter tunicatorum]BDD06053.1 MATE family efflux transporter [Aureibacter tunicatorum]